MAHSGELSTKLAIQALDQRLDTLQDVVQELAGGLEDLATRERQAKPAPAWWPDMGDEERLVRWAELVAWIRDVLAVRYSREAGRAVTRCWADHPTAVDALTSAWLTWQTAYRDRSAGPDVAATWQTDTLPALLERTAAELSGCRDGCQQPATPPRLWAD